ncbi:MAG: hypothetical protein V1933_08250 [Candidatus Omnitrophota bacterium]
MLIYLVEKRIMTQSVKRGMMSRGLNKVTYETVYSTLSRKFYTVRASPALSQKGRDESRTMEMTASACAFRAQTGVGSPLSEAEGRQGQQQNFSTHPPQADSLEE